MAFICRYLLNYGNYLLIPHRLGLTSSKSLPRRPPFCKVLHPLRAGSQFWNPRDADKVRETAHARNRRTAAQLNHHFFFVPPSFGPSVASFLRDLAIPALDSTTPSCQQPLESSKALAFFLLRLRCGSFLCPPALLVTFCLRPHMPTRFDLFQQRPTISHSRCLPVKFRREIGWPMPPFTRAKCHFHNSSMNVKKTIIMCTQHRRPSPPTTHRCAACVVLHQTK